MNPEEFRFKPNGDRVYIRLDELPEKSGLVYLSEKQAAPTRIGTVLTVGDEAKVFKAGDRIAISSFSGANLYLWAYGIKDERYRVLTENEILGWVME
jgi:co-chaperonin GroES (HSP10)